jgi:hypothetical protein
MGNPSHFATSQSSWVLLASLTLMLMVFMGLVSGGDGSLSRRRVGRVVRCVLILALGVDREIEDQVQVRMVRDLLLGHGWGLWWVEVWCCG